MASPVFAKMLHSNFKESNLGQIQLPDKKSNDIHELLKMIYPSFPGTLEGRNIVFQ
jgi:hypothetical protein